MLTKSNKSSKNARVLIAEDSRVNQAIAKSLFQRAGIEAANITVVENGLLALDHVKERHSSSDVLIIYMDHDMPVMTGSEAVNKIRAIEQELGLPKSFIFTCSASCTTPIIGSDVRVPKKLDLAVVEDLIRQAETSIAKSDQTACSVAN